MLEHYMTPYMYTVVPAEVDTNLAGEEIQVTLHMPAPARDLGHACSTRKIWDLGFLRSFLVYF